MPDIPVCATRDIPWSEIVKDSRFKPGQIAIPKGTIGIGQESNGDTRYVFWLNLDRDLLVAEEAVEEMPSIPSAYGLEWEDDIPDIAKLTVLQLLRNNGANLVG